MKPLKDLLVIQLDERKQTSAAGIYIKEAWESAINSGTILDADQTLLLKLVHE